LISQSFAINPGETLIPDVVTRAIQSAALQANGGIVPTGHSVDPKVVTAAENEARRLADLPPEKKGSPYKILQGFDPIAVRCLVLVRRTRWRLGKLLLSAFGVVDAVR